MKEKEDLSNINVPRDEKMFIGKNIAENITRQQECDNKLVNNFVKESFTELCKDSEIERIKGQELVLRKLQKLSTELQRNDLAQKYIDLLLESLEELGVVDVVAFLKEKKQQFGL